MRVFIIGKSLCGDVSNQVQYNMESAQYLGLNYYNNNNDNKYILYIFTYYYYIITITDIEHSSNYIAFGLPQIHKVR